jgi:hypothetical protein
MDEEIAKILAGFDFRKGHCYIDSLMVASKLLAHNINCSVVHGRPIYCGAEKTSDGRHDHAWVEVRVGTGSGMLGAWFDCVIDTNQAANLGGFKGTIPKMLYYGIGRIDGDEVRRYSISDAVRMCDAYGNCGPWPDHAQCEVRDSCARPNGHKGRHRRGRR